VPYFSGSKLSASAFSIVVSFFSAIYRYPYENKAIVSTLPIQDEQGRNSMSWPYEPNFDIHRVWRRHR
jgi:hypothetical protein